MKRIPLGEITIRNVTGKASDVYKQWLEVPTPGSGLDIGAVRSRLRVLDALDAVNGAGHVDLEDADYDTLKACIQSTQFVVVDKGIVDLADRVLNAEPAPK